MDTDPPIRVHLHSTGDLIAAVPALLGFHPTDSLIAIYLRQDRLVLAARQDLASLAERPDALITPTSYVPTDTVHLILITDSAGGVDGSPPQAAAVGAVRDRMRQAGVNLAHAAWAPAVQPGQPWYCYDDPTCRGSIPDPHTTPLARAATEAGQPIHPSRDALTRQLHPDDPQALRRRAALICAHPPMAAADGQRLVRDAVRAATDGQLPGTDEHIATLAVALSDPRTRDHGTGYALGDQAGAAERLWTALVRGTPPPHRANPAILLALSAYLRGNGALATLALHTGGQAQPGNSMIRLLHTPIAVGLPPQSIRDVLTATTAAHPAPGVDTG
jgi:hypothetical protein